MKKATNEMGKLRRSKGLSQTQLAEKVTEATGINIDQRTISTWETGHTSPKPFQYQFLEDFFGVPKEVIFADAFNYKDNK